MALEEEELRKKEVHSAPTEETPPKPLEQHEDTEEGGCGFTVLP